MMGADNSSDWFVMILNAQSGMPKQLLYQLRVSCTSIPLCPAPVWAGNSNATEPCSGNGDCQVPRGCKNSFLFVIAALLPEEIIESLFAVHHACVHLA